MYNKIQLYNEHLINMSYQLVQCQILKQRRERGGAIKQPLLSQFRINKIIIGECDSNLYQSLRPMYQIIYQPTVPKLVIGVLVGVLYCLGIHYLLSFYFVHYTIITIGVSVLTLLAVMRAIGTFAMYPGSYRYLAAQIEKTQNDNLLHGIHKDMESIQKISSRVLDYDLGTLKRNYHQLYGSHILESLSTQLNVLQKSQKPSDKKVNLINTFNISLEWSQKQNKSKTTQNQQQGIHKVQGQQISLAKIITNNANVMLIKHDSTLQQLKLVAANTIRLCRKIWNISESITKIPVAVEDQEVNITDQMVNADIINNQARPLDTHKFHIADWQLFSQKLFTMNSYYAFWDNVLEYTTVMVPLGGNDYLQCAIIHGQKNTHSSTIPIEQNRSRPKRAVLFCNPNGGFAQTIALSSTYMKFYISLGFQIILWNYRGYAKSTGIASITKCISDVYCVYKFAAKTYHLKIEVLHGYSIGGVCAINLAYKLNSNKNKPIKLLIADRTFSSIDNVAYGFIRKNNKFAKLVRKLSRPLVKLLFPSDCIDNSQIFMKCHCDKVCIWDTNDAIISDVASLKFSLLKHARKPIKQVKKQDGQESCLQLESNNNNFDTQAIRFGEAASKIYSQDYRVYQRIMKVLYDTDGGGDKIYIKALSNQNKDLQPCGNYIKAKCARYFTGLAIYGPKLCVPHGRLIDDAELTQWFRNRINKRIQLIQHQIASMPNQTRQKHTIQFSAILNGLHFVIQKLNSQNYQKSKQKFGNLIVSQVGHNSDLKKQYIQLEKYLRKSVLKGTANLQQGMVEQQQGNKTQFQFQKQ